ncbi:MAG TPA: hypothetical protein VMD52_06100 [Patescibacteria group bacterium]|nr:hypothetical protein [Patescibacteria group bacterium]
MTVLFFLIIIAFLCLAALAVFVLGRPKNSAAAPGPAPEPVQRKPSAAVLEDQVHYLTEELEKLKLQNQGLVSELELQKNKEFDLKEDLQERKRWEDSQRGEMEILQQENMRLHQEILDKETQQSMRIPPEIEDQLKAKTFRVQALEQENAQTAEKIRKLEASMAEVRLTQKRSESVYKQEYESLLKQFQLKEEALRRLQGELKRSEEEYGLSTGQKDELSQQLSQREEQLRQLREELKRAQAEVSRFQEDYIKLDKELKAKEAALQELSAAQASTASAADIAASGPKDVEEKRNGLKKMLESLEKKPEGGDA